MASDKDASEQLNFVTSPFDAIRYLDGEREFWRARELSYMEFNSSIQFSAHLNHPCDLRISF